MYNFDKAATVKPNLKVVSKAMPYITTEYGNPSSVYSFGKICKQAIEKSRNVVANYLNADSDEIVFTSSSSESNNAAILGFIRKNKCKNVICSTIEHVDILECVEYISKNEVKSDPHYCDVDEKGKLNLVQLEDYCKKYPQSLVIVQMVNNELGTIENIRKISSIAHNYSCFLFTDATQAITKVEIDVKDLKVDMLSFGGHKIHGFRGVGVLYVRKNVELTPLVFGHQNGVVAGTENTAAIVSIGAALELDHNSYYVKIIRDYFEKKMLEMPNTYINGDLDNRIYNISNVCISGYDSQTLQMMLDSYGICVSMGSACNSKEIVPSHVLKAIGLEAPDIYSCLRFSFDEDNTMEEVDYVIDKIKVCLNSLDMLKRINQEEKKEL